MQFLRIILISFLISCSSQAHAIGNFLGEVWLHMRYHAALVSSIANQHYQFKFLGSENANKSIQRVVVELKQEMGIKKVIYVKKMSDNALRLFGNENAFSTHNAIFIDEEWLLRLDKQSQRCLLAHELHHIQHCDVMRTYILHIALILVSLKMMTTGPLIIPGAILILITPLIMLAFKRYQEKRADQAAATVVGSDQTQQFLKNNLFDDKHDGLMDWFLSFFSSYPTQEERISYIQKNKSTGQRA